MHVRLGHDYTQDTINHECICNRTTAECCKAVIHISLDESQKSKPVNRHERRKLRKLAERSK